MAPLELPAGCLGDLLSRPHLRAIWFLTPSLSGVEISVDPQPIHSPKRDLQDEVTHALPRWLVVEYADRFPVYPVRLGPSGVDKQIFLGIREADVEIDYVRAFLAMALAHRDAADPIPRKPRAEAQRRRGGRGLGEGAPEAELD